MAGLLLAGLHFHAGVPWEGSGRPCNAAPNPHSTPPFRPPSPAPAALTQASPGLLWGKGEAGGWAHENAHARYGGEKPRV